MIRVHKRYVSQRRLNISVSGGLYAPYTEREEMWLVQNPAD